MTAISIRLSAEEVARIDEMHGWGVSRSAFLRDLLRRSGPVEEQPSYPDALTLLARSARAGKVQAQVALELCKKRAAPLARTWGRSANERSVRAPLASMIGFRLAKRLRPAASRWSRDPRLTEPHDCEDPSAWGWCSRC